MAYNVRHTLAHRLDARGHSAGFANLAVEHNAHGVIIRVDITSRVIQLQLTPTQWTELTKQPD